jgi:hypothetical protein
MSFLGDVAALAQALPVRSRGRAAVDMGSGVVGIAGRGIAVGIAVESPAASIAQPEDSATLAGESRASKSMDTRAPVAEALDLRGTIGARVAVTHRLDHRWVGGEAGGWVAVAASVIARWMAALSETCSRAW